MGANLFRIHLIVWALSISGIAHGQILKDSNTTIKSLLDSSIAIQNTDSALLYAKQAIKAASQAENDSLRRLAQYQLGKILCSKGKHQEAVDIYVPLQMELINNDGDQNFKLNVYESIGTCYGDLKKSVKSLEYLFLVAGELEKMPTSKKNDDRLAQTYTQIAICYGKSDKHDQTAVFIKKAIKIHEKYNDKTSLVKDYNNIGYTYFRLERYKEAEQNLLKGLAISHDDGSLNESLSELYIGQGKLNLALPYAVTAYNDAYKRKEDRRIQYRKQLILEALEINEIEDKEAMKVKPEVLKKDVTSKNTSSNNHSPYVVSLIIILVISNLFFGVIWLRNRSN